MKVVNESKLQEVLNYVNKKKKKNGISPSFRNISHNISGLSLATAHSYVNILEKRGLLQKTEFGKISRLLSFIKSSSYISFTFEIIYISPKFFESYFNSFCDVVITI